MEKQKRHSFATAPSGAALNDIKNPENILNNAEAQGLRCTHMQTHTFPKDNDTNKMAYIFQYVKDWKNFATMQIVFVGIRLVKWKWIPVFLKFSMLLHVNPRQHLYVLAIKYCAHCSLTQHSRPHTLDHLFSPILVEALSKRKKKKMDEGCEVTQGQQRRAQ